MPSHANRNKYQNNWIKQGLALLYTKDGLLDVVKEHSRNFQQHILRQLEDRVCSTCTTENIVCGELPLKETEKRCPNNVCNCICGLIRKYHRFYDPGKYEPPWHNTNAATWCTDDFSIAKCFMSSFGYARVMTWEETDLEGILSFLINNTFWTSSTVSNIDGETDIFSQVRAISKQFANSTSIVITNSEVNKYVHLLEKLIFDSKKHKESKSAAKVIPKLRKLRTSEQAVSNEDVDMVISSFISQTTGKELEIMNEIKKDLSLLLFQNFSSERVENSYMQKKISTMLTNHQNIKNDMKTLEQELRKLLEKLSKIKTEQEADKEKTRTTERKVKHFAKEIATPNNSCSAKHRNYFTQHLKDYYKRLISAHYNRLPHATSDKGVRNLSFTVSTHVKRKASPAPNLTVSGLLSNVIDNKGNTLVIANSSLAARTLCLEMLEVWSQTVCVEIEPVDVSKRSALVHCQIPTNATIGDIYSYAKSECRKQLSCSEEIVINGLKQCQTCVLLLEASSVNQILSIKEKGCFIILAVIVNDNDNSNEARSKFENVFQISSEKSLELKMTQEHTTEEYARALRLKDIMYWCLHRPDVYGSIAFIVLNDIHLTRNLSNMIPPISDVNTIKYVNCDAAIRNSASEIIVEGTSILHLNTILEKSKSAKTLTITFSVPEKSIDNIHTLNERIVRALVASTEICPELQCIRLENVYLGLKKFTCCIENSELKRFLPTLKEKTPRLASTILLGHCLEKHSTTLELERLDFDYERSEFAKSIILDFSCHSIVKQIKNVTEAYAAKNEQDDVHIVCFTKQDTTENPCPRIFKGFVVASRSIFPVENKYMEVECDRSDLEYSFKEKYASLNKTIANNYALFNTHSNLEAISGSMVRLKDNTACKSAPCIVLYCKWKSQVPYGEAEFPKSLKDQSGKFEFETDIREGFFLLGPNGYTLTADAKEWNQEMAMGCSIGPSNGQYSATLGPFVNVAGTDGVSFLTVRHMFQPLAIHDSQLKNTKILQPANGDQGINTQGAHQILSEEERECGTVIASLFSENVDATLVKICKNRMPKRGNFVGVTKEALDLAGFSMNNFPVYDDGSILNAEKLSTADYATERVIKFGRKTGLTKGSLELTHMAVKISDQVKLGINHNGRWEDKVMKYQLKVNSHLGDPFFARGDSGAAVFLVGKNNKLHCIGMAIGIMPDQSCVVTPIQTILDSLGQQLHTKLELKTFKFEEME